MELIDRSETPAMLEPLIPEEASRHRPGLDALARQLAEASRALAAGIPEDLRPVIRDLVRRANAVHSHAIEGLKIDPAGQEVMRHLGIEAWLDGDGFVGSPLSAAALCEIHRRLCMDLPAEELQLPRPGGGSFRMAPGELRTIEVQVGRHVAPSPGSVPRLLAHMGRMYGFQGGIGRVFAAACAHHRLAHVHPFPDFNGRVTRLVAVEMMRRAIGAPLFWSLSRALGQNLERYHQQLAAADEMRHGGADGRGHLSEARLAEFATFFLEVCLREVEEMACRMKQDMSLRAMKAAVEA